MGTGKICQGSKKMEEKMERREVKRYSVRENHEKTDGALNHL